MPRDVLWSPEALAQRISDLDRDLYELLTQALPDDDDAQARGREAHEHLAAAVDLVGQVPEPSVELLQQPPTFAGRLTPAEEIPAPPRWLVVLDQAWVLLRTNPGTQLAVVAAEVSGIGIGVVLALLFAGGGA